MKMNEITALSDQEMTKMLAELGKEGFNLRIQAKTGQLQNTARIRQIKHDVARLMTEQNRRVRESK